MTDAGRAAHAPARHDSDLPLPEAWPSRDSGRLKVTHTIPEYSLSISIKFAQFRSHPDTHNPGRVEMADQAGGDWVSQK
jgi:hypothetical protein